MCQQPLHIYLLGDFRVVSDQRVAAIGGRLPSLLAYLVLRRHAPQPRQHLAFLLWPDSTEAQARTNLRKGLLQLRQTLPQADDYLLLEGQTVQWRPDGPFWLDVAAFETAVVQAVNASEPTSARQALEQAVALYAGSLLPSCYDDWLAPERERLSQMFGATLERLIALLEAQGAIEPAIEYAQRLLRHDPLDETVYRSLMRLLAESGNRAGALRVYHAGVMTLHRELGVDPSPATRRLYEDLLQIDDRSALPMSSEQHRPPLVGRRHKWETLRAAWDMAHGGAPQFVVIAGEAGIGKTRLAEEIVEWGRRQGALADSTLSQRRTSWASPHVSQADSPYSRLPSRR